jgi:hypothetical protein
VLQSAEASAHVDPQKNVNCRSVTGDLVGWRIVTSVPIGMDNPPLSLASSSSTVVAADSVVVVACSILLLLFTHGVLK